MSETTAASPAFKGVPLFMNGADYFIPSLSLRQFQENFALLTDPVGEVAQDSLQAQFEKFIPVILLALQRNYPDVTSENLYDWLDLGTFREAFLAVQGASGMKPAKPGE
jgi:hypothetical protein